MIQSKRMGAWHEFLVPEEWAGKTVEELFKQTWEAPKKLTHQFRMEKWVMVNHVPVNWTIPLVKGDRLMINFYENLENDVMPSYMNIEILFEDDHLLIVNKPAGIDTHPNDPGQVNTLLNGVAFYLQSKGLPTWVRHIHRLDRDTTGAILFAKHPLVGSVLDRMLEQRQIKRTYLALVHGLMKHKKGTINEPIGRDRHHATRRRVSPSGQDAITHFELINLYQKDNTSLVKCWLDTGRTHQIRVHLSHIGYPLIGDLLYGGKLEASRQALHAAKLEFVHPLTKELICCFAPFLDDAPIFPSLDLKSIL
ncbi:RluA family pseudouridine synthase [Pseudoneobacillus rhizosphaerae]|uniref:Pseudouridine synthase n=1 Tax=Pseudoneobacillus rhizosphaerae TaxID=2880968 RepID=A0A9C7GBT2_9BACI|nr:RluA family pseudouridine synthase [Pseudoneobacillus rhizosphaerae]CAG9609549.1 Ribosomal large subunit pseudouridine synthase D [Pseudoneobacillus rhizosphaerae]